MYLEKKLLYVSINCTPNTSASCLKKMVQYVFQVMFKLPQVAGVWFRVGTARSHKQLEAFTASEFSGISLCSIDKAFQTAIFVEFLRQFSRQFQVACHVERPKR